MDIKKELGDFWNETRNFRDDLNDARAQQDVLYMDLNYRTLSVGELRARVSDSTFLYFLSDDRTKYVIHDSKGAVILSKEAFKERQKEVAGISNYLNGGLYIPIVYEIIDNLISKPVGYSMNKGRERILNKELPKLKEIAPDKQLEYLKKSEQNEVSRSLLKCIASIAPVYYVVLNSDSPNQILPIATAAFLVDFATYITYQTRGKGDGYATLEAAISAVQKEATIKNWPVTFDPKNLK